MNAVVSRVCASACVIAPVTDVVRLGECPFVCEENLYFYQDLVFRLFLPCNVDVTWARTLSLAVCA